MPGTPGIRPPLNDWSFRSSSEFLARLLNGHCLVQRFRVEPHADDGRLQEVGGQPGEGARGEHIVHGAFQKHLFVVRSRHAFLGGDESRAHAPQVSMATADYKEMLLES